MDTQLKTGEILMIPPACLLSILNKSLYILLDKR